MEFKISKNVSWWLVIGAAAIFVFIVSMILSIGQSIWFDEGYSILLAKSSWSDLVALTAVDAHPPFYYLLLKAWASVFGYSEFALRSLSAVMLSGAVVVVSMLLRKLFSSKVALLALPVIILAPFLLRYGYEVRMYSTALLIGVAGTYALVNAQRDNKWWQWALYAAIVALGMYTLYMTAVIWLAHVVWLAIQSFKKPRAPFLQWRWLYAYVGAVLLYVPYLPTFIYQMTHSALPGIGRETTLTGFVDSATVLFAFTPEWKIGGWLSLLIVTGVVLVAWVGAKTVKYLSKKERVYFALMTCMVLVPLGFYTLISLPPSSPIFVNRYLAHVAIWIYGYIGIILAFGIVYRSKLKTGRAVPYLAFAAVLLVLSVGVYTLQKTGNFVFERMQYPETQQVQSAIDCSAETTVVADDPYTYIDAMFYFDNCDLRFFSEEPVKKQGGYAPLHDSAVRVASPGDVTASQLVRLSWVGNEPSFVPDDRYELVTTMTFDKQQVDFYQLSAE